MKRGGRFLTGAAAGFGLAIAVSVGVVLSDQAALGAGDEPLARLVAAAAVKPLDATKARIGLSRAFARSADPVRLVGAGDRRLMNGALLAAAAKEARRRNAASFAFERIGGRVRPAPMESGAGRFVYEINAVVAFDPVSARRVLSLAEAERQAEALARPL